MNMRAIKSIACIDKIVESIIYKRIFKSTFYIDKRIFIVICIHSLLMNKMFIISGLIIIVDVSLIIY